MSATDQATWEKWFQDVWSEREDVLYRQFFGGIGETIHTIPALLFERLGYPQVDQRWLTHGVFACPPQPNRDTWVYVTSALSNPWGEDPTTINPANPSGLGFELLLETPREEEWAIQVLHWLMAVQILAASGFLQGDLVEPGFRVPLHTSIDPQSDSAIRHLLITVPSAYPAQFQLPSGKVAFLLCLGITDQENEFAREKDSDVLLKHLLETGVYPVTDAQRGSSL